MTIITFPEGTDTIERIPIPPPKDALPSAECIQQVRALHLKSAQVAVFKLARDRSASASSSTSTASPEIYDNEAKVITHSFNDLEHFERIYSKDEVGHHKSRWARMTGWSGRLKRKLKGKEDKEYEVEIWRQR
jgi:hypothetical protein